MMIPVGGPDDERPIVWKWMEPFGGTHVRELRLALPSHPEIDLRATQTNAVAEWLGYGVWSDNRTRLDDLAQTADLQRETFGESLLMRVPRGWRTKKFDDYRYAVEPADEAETLWVSFEIYAVTGMEPALFDKFVSEVEKGAQERIEPADRLLDQSDERIGEYDRLANFMISKEDEQGPLRRLWWRRYSWSEGIHTTVLIHLCTDRDRIGEPRFVESAALIEREVRNAAVIPLRPRR